MGVIKMYPCALFNNFKDFTNEIPKIFRANVTGSQKADDALISRIFLRSSRDLDPEIDRVNDCLHHTFCSFESCSR